MENEAPASKRQKPLSLLEDVKYLEPAIYLTRMKDHWNILDVDELFCLGDNNIERRRYLGDMRQVIEKGECDYMNPFGADDRENFIEYFLELTKSERQKFLKCAKLCTKQNRMMKNEDLNQVLLACRPPQPIWISLDPKTIAENSEGTERFPYASIDQASCELPDNGNTFPDIQIICAPDCEKVQCTVEGCQKMVCTEHGCGEGQIGAYTVFKISKCTDCEVITCYDHFLADCDVCRNGTDAQASLIGDTFPEDYFPVCDGCATVCEKEVEDCDGIVCGFRCCKRCSERHTCGDDPTEYC